MSDPKKVPGDLGGAADWDKLLDDLDGKVEGALQPSAAPPPAAPATVTERPPEPAKSGGLYRPPGAPRPAAPKPTPTPAQAAAKQEPAPAPITTPPPRHEAYTSPGEEEERTVVGVIPRELMAESLRGGGLSQFLKRDQPTRDEEPKDALMGALLGDAEAGEADDDLVTSAPNLAKKPPPPPRPRSASDPRPGDAPPPPVRQPSQPDEPVSLADPFVAPTPAAVPAPPPPAPSPVPAPTAARAAEPLLPPAPPAAPPSPSSPAIDDQEPASSTGPKLLEPEERLYSAEEHTMVVDLRRTERPAAPSASEIDLLRVGDEEEREGSLPGTKTSPPPAMDRSERETRPLSLEPPPLPPLPQSPWPDERDAASHLSDAGQLDAFRERATWLEAELRESSDKAVRARGLLAISELVAMTGDQEQASTLASEARDLAPQSPLAQRQVRAQAVRDRAFDELVPMLDAELRVASTPVARAHGSWLAAEITRVRTGDIAAAAKRLEAATRAVPSDPRPHVLKLAAELASSDKPVKYRWPDAPGLAPLVSGVTTLGALRGATVDKDPPASPLEALTRARLELAAGNVPGAVESFAQMKDVRDVGEGALWLAASLAAASPATRPRAFAFLRDVSRGMFPDLALRSLATRALEGNDAEVARDALAGGRVFSDAERASLGALLAGGEDFLGAARAIASDESLAPLAAAVQAHLTKGVSDAGAGAPALRAATALGRALARGGDVTAQLDALREQDTTSDLPRLLELDAHVSARRPEALAALLGGGEGGSPDQDRDRSLVTSVAFEVSGDVERAVSSARAALLSDASSEAAARALVALAPDEAALLLEALAGNVEEPVRRALLLIEAAARIGLEADGYLTLLRQAHDAAPNLPFAAAMGARAARRAGDVAALLGWIRLRRESAEDPSEAAFDLVREAMLVADGDLALAVSQLEEAGRARPDDIALRDLLERLSPDAAANRAAIRAARAEKAPPTSKARLSLLAAYDVELADGAEAAAKLAADAVEAGGGDLAKLARDRLDAFGPGAARLAEELMAVARDAKEPAAEREAYERLAYLDEVGRGDVASGLLWHRSILERDASALPSLRRLEHALVAEAREDELEPIFSEIAKVTEGKEAAAHARVAARLRERGGTWEQTRDLVEIAARVTPPGLWALRQLLAHAQVAGDDDAVLRATMLLVERTDRATERATLLLRAAEATARKGQTAEAAELLGKVIELSPAHPIAHMSLAEVREKLGDFKGAAEALEVAASVSDVEAHQVQLRYDAAVLWLDKVADRERGVHALEAVADVNVLYAETFPRLSALYVELGERQKLASLLERRLEREEDPDRRVELEVTRGRALADVGDVAAAKAALAAALEGSPDHVDALLAFSELCGKDGDWEGAEQALIRLARLASEPAQQADIYQRLGAIYEDQLPNLERAELAYREVLKRAPDSVHARERLVAIFAEQRDAPRALEIQGQLLAGAKDPAEKRQRTIELSRLHEELSGDVRKAEQTLEALRKEMPNDAAALRALAEFHVRHNHGPAVNILLDRTAADARRALHTGRFEMHLFANLATVFELRGNADAARVAKATLGALEGEPADIQGIGLRGARGDLDELLAPEVFTPAFRELLRQAGAALDGATAIDLKGMRAAPFPVSTTSIASQIQEIGAAFGLPNTQLLVSPAVGPICLPLAAGGPTLVFGAALVAEPNEAIRHFLTLRAFKILAGHVAAFARTAPIDLWPLTAAFLQTFAPSWTPQGVDQNKLNDFRSRIQRSMPSGIGPEAGALALEVIGSIGNRASTLQTNANAWGDRAALLATGDVNGALDAIAFAAGQPAGAPSGPERLRWIGRNAEARDVVVFSVSNEYAEARRRAS